MGIWRWKAGRVNSIYYEVSMNDTNKYYLLFIKCINKLSFILLD